MLAAGRDSFAGRMAFGAYYTASETLALPGNRCFISITHCPLSIIHYSLSIPLDCPSPWLPAEYNSALPAAPQAAAALYQLSIIHCSLFIIHYQFPLAALPLGYPPSTTRRLSYDTRLDCMGQSGAPNHASTVRSRQGRSAWRLVFGTAGSRLDLAIFQTSCMDTRAKGSKTSKGEERCLSISLVLMSVKINSTHSVVTIRSKDPSITMRAALKSYAHG